MAGVKESEVVGPVTMAPNVGPPLKNARQPATKVRFDRMRTDEQLMRECVTLVIVAITTENVVLRASKMLMQLFVTMWNVAIQNMLQVVRILVKTTMLVITNGTMDVCNRYAMSVKSI